MGKQKSFARRSGPETPGGGNGPAWSRGVPAGLREEAEDPIKILRHDLRDSIGVIQNTLVLLREETGMASEKARTYFDMLNRQALKLEQIVDQARFRLRAPRS